jgi:hypothetical protein
MLRLLIDKNLMSTTIEIKDAATEETHYTLHRPFTFFRKRVEVKDRQGNPLGFFKSRILTLGGVFDVYADENTKIAEVKSSWTGRNFTSRDIQGNKIGLVTNKVSRYRERTLHYLQQLSGEYIGQVSAQFQNDGVAHYCLTGYRCSRI